MRLSTREVNAQGRLSKSPTQLDWSVLSSSADSWPPLLPSFSEETVEALDRFVQGFICKRIEYRCGQLSAVLYTESILPQWITMAENRTALMESFFAQQGSRLGEETFQRVFGAFERLQSALRDAWQEQGEVEDLERYDKKITFARPVAHRLIRRSRDRFSLRSVADVDDSMESTRLSSSPRMLEVADTLRGSLQRESLSPLPCGAAPLFDHDGDDGRTVVLPVEEGGDGDHFTGRASGVYYGDIFHSARSSACSNGDCASELPSATPAPHCPPCTHPLDNYEPTGSSGHDHAVGRSPSFANVCRGPSLHSAAWRRWWLLLFYYALLPVSVAWCIFGGYIKVTMF